MSLPLNAPYRSNCEQAVLCPLSHFCNKRAPWVRGGPEDMTDLGTPDQEADLQSVVNALARLTSPDDVRALFDEILTPAERQSIALRWRLMQMLRDGIPQRRIAKQLGISLCKITRGSRVLKNPESMVRRLLNVERDAGAPPSQQDPR